jgi:Trk K+ transport system NAD-binding subunit
MSNRLVIIGSGRIGSDLIQRLPKEFEIICIDQNADPGEPPLTDKDSSKCTLVQGDATSRLVLEQAGVEEADMVILTTSTEKINLEVARILREKFHVPRIISIGITPEGIEELENLDVDVANIFEASSHSILNILESQIRTPQGIGTGQGEILEVIVHAQSRLVNKPLARLAPKNWQVGIIYREDKIIVPGGSVRLLPQDRVVIMGDPSTLKSVAALLTFSTHDFPIEYGSLALVYLSGSEKEDYFSEVEYLLNTLPFGEAVFMLSPSIRDRGPFQPFFERCPHIYTVHSSSAGKPFNAILESVKILWRNCGLIIGQKDVLLGSPGLLPYRNRRTRTIARCLEQLYAPMVFCAGTFPYKEVVMPAIPPADTKPLLETALEISAQLASELSVLLCSPSKYTGGEEEKVSFDTMKKTISDMGLLYKRKIPATPLKGNPVLEVISHLQDKNLLVLEPQEWGSRSYFSSLLNPDPFLHILAQSSITTIVQPSESVKKNSLSPAETNR